MGWGRARAEGAREGRAAVRGVPATPHRTQPRCCAGLWQGETSAGGLLQCWTRQLVIQAPVDLREQNWWGRACGVLCRPVLHPWACACALCAARALRDACRSPWLSWQVPLVDVQAWLLV